MREGRLIGISLRPGCIYRRGIYVNGKGLGKGCCCAGIYIVLRWFYGRGFSVNIWKYIRKLVKFNEK